MIFVLTDQKKVGFDKLHLSVNIFYRDVKFLMFCKNINMNITLHIQYTVYVLKCYILSLIKLSSTRLATI